ncbi:type II secretion system F family protein [Undibacterium curvum]|uniref:type II secretion system F family protein n=1 Tax=Undibacterium curvum TaxID=2762294 RepID=UPI003D0BCAED
MASSVPVMPFSVRAQMFTHLALMEKSGLSAHHAFSLLRLPARLQPRVQRALRELKRGKDIATAGQIAGLLSDLESQLLRAACQAGSPAVLYQRLADNYTQRSAQIAAVRSRLRFPLLILLIALCVRPLPQLVSGQISGTAYLGGLLLPFLLLGVLAWLISRLWQTLERGDSAIADSVLRGVQHVPVLGRFQLRHDARNFYESLGLLLEAGVPVFDAVPKASQTVRNPALRMRFRAAVKELHAGRSLYQALMQVPDGGSGAIMPLLNVAEQSGTLSETLLRYAAQENAQLADSWRQLADWLPRLFYAVIAIWIAMQLLSGPGIMPRMPADVGFGNQGGLPAVVNS